MEERAGVRRHVLPRQGTTWADLLHTTAGIENKGANTHDKTKQLEARARARRAHRKRESGHSTYASSAGCKHHHNARLSLFLFPTTGKQGHAQKRYLMACPRMPPRKLRRSRHATGGRHIEEEGGGTAT